MARTPPARTAGQRPLIAVVAAVVLALGALVVAGEETSSGSVDDGGGPAPAAEAGRTAQAVGPVRGADVTSYVDDRTTALLEAPAGVDTAVVSFSDVLELEDALALVGDAGAVRVVLYQLPLEQAPARSVRVGESEDAVAALEAALTDQVELLREEQASVQELLDSGTVEDEEFVAEYERRIEEAEAAIAAAADLRVVHAVVLRAPLAALQDLVDATAVRLVDPAPPDTDVGLSSFVGLLPADAETISQGRAA